MFPLPYLHRFQIRSSIDLILWYSKDLISNRKFIDEYKMLGCSSVDFNNLTNLKIDSDLKLNFFNRNDSLELFLNNSNNYLIKLIS